jgi:hypothetical protein
MKHKRSLISVAMVTIMVVSLCAVGASAAQGSNANVQSPAQVGSSEGSAPAVCAPGSLYDLSNIALFVKGADNALWWKQYKDSTGWTEWQSLGGYLTSDPAVTSKIPSYASERMMQVFVRGTDGALWTRTTYDGGNSWTDWYSYGGQLLAGTGPTAYNWPNQRVGWFVTGTDHALWHKWIEIGFHGWESRGGYLTSSPAAGSSADSTDQYVGVFVRGGDSALWVKGYEGGWSGWGSLGGQIAPGTAPAASAWYHRVDVFVQGTDGALWHRVNNGVWPGAWSGWQSIGGKCTSSPAVLASPTSVVAEYKYVKVFVRGTDGALWQNTYANGNNQWSGWTSIGGTP